MISSNPQLDKTEPCCFSCGKGCDELVGIATLYRCGSIVVCEKCDKELGTDVVGANRHDRREE